MIRRTATLLAFLAALTLGFGTTSVMAEGEKSACEQKADKKKITDEKKRAAFIKKCEAKKGK